MPELHWWPRFCEAMGRPEWVADPRFETVKSRFDHMTDLTDLIDKEFATKTLAEWGLTFDEHGLIWGPVATVAELAPIPKLRRRDSSPKYVIPTGHFAPSPHPSGSQTQMSAPGAQRRS